jgi:large repetitive protein
MRYMFLLIALFAIIGIASSVELKNTVTASAVDGSGANVSSSADAAIIINETASGILLKDVEKKAYKPGEMANYTFRLSNTGTARLTDIKVVDDLLGPIAMSASEVGPGEFAEGTAQMMVTEDMLPGPVINYAVATMNGAGTSLSLNASAVFEIEAIPEILITKLTDVSSADIGKEVVYTFTIENTGSRTLYNVEAVDDKLGEIALPKTTLAPGEKATVTKNHMVTIEDIEG